MNTIIRGLNAVIAAPFNAINNIFDRLRGLSILKLSPFSWLPSVGVPQIPQLAEGGEGAGTAMVGEEGPEILDLPRGATVIPLSRSSISIGIEDLNDKMDTLIDLFLQLIAKRFGVYIDKTTLVGILAPDMDEAIGQRAIKAGRFAET